MSAIPTSAVPNAGACRIRKTGRSLHLHLPIVVGAFAAAGAIGQLDVASLDSRQGFEQARTMRLVEDARSLGQVVAPASESAATVSIVATAADRLRNDAVQTAPVPMRVSAPHAPVKLSRDERTLARYIARSYRIAQDSVERFVHHAYRAAKEFSLDPHLVLAVMAVESSFDPFAESAAGAQGLMQVLTRVHTNKFEPYGGVDAAWDPVANIKVGARILSEYVNRHGDVAAGLKAYVGAALLPSDGGYGSKVLKRQAEFDAVLRPPTAPVTAPPVMEASADQAPSGGAAAGSIGASGSSAASGASIGL